MFRSAATKVAKTIIEVVNNQNDRGGAILVGAVLGGGWLAYDINATYKQNPGETEQQRNERFGRHAEGALNAIGVGDGKKFVDLVSVAMTSAGEYIKSEYNKDPVGYDEKAGYAVSALTGIPPFELSKNPDLSVESKSFVGGIKSGSGQTKGRSS